MKKIITSSVLAMLLLSGCGNGAEESAENLLEIMENGEYADLKGVVTKNLHKDLNTDVFKCVNRKVTLKTASADLMSAIDEKLKSVRGFSKRWAESDKVIIMAIINNKPYKTIQQCHKASMYQNIENFEILDSKINKSDDEAVVETKLKIKNKEGFKKVKIKVIKDEERGWIVSGF